MGGEQGFLAFEDRRGQGVVGGGSHQGVVPQQMPAQNLRAVERAEEDAGERPQGNDGSGQRGRQAWGRARAPHPFRVDPRQGQRQSSRQEPGFGPQGLLPQVTHGHQPGRHGSETADPEPARGRSPGQEVHRGGDRGPEQQDHHRVLRCVMGRDPEHGQGEEPQRQQRRRQDAKGRAHSGLDGCTERVHAPLRWRSSTSSRGGIRRYSSRRMARVRGEWNMETMRIPSGSSRST